MRLIDRDPVRLDDQALKVQHVRGDGKKKFKNWRGKPTIQGKWKNDTIVYRRWKNAMLMNKKEELILQKEETTLVIIIRRKTNKT